MRRISFSRALYLYVMCFVFIPILLALAYVSYDAYKMERRLAQSTAEAAAQVLASRLENQLSEKRNLSFRLSTDNALAEVAVNILFSQHALNVLQSVVEADPLIKAAFIADQSGFVIEGYPLVSLRLESDWLGQLTTGQMARPLTDNTPMLWQVPKAHLQRAFADEPQHDGLMFSVPLMMDMPSMVEPQRITAVLYLLLDGQALMRDLAPSQTALSQSVRLLMADEPLMQDSVGRVTMPLEHTVTLPFLAQTSQGSRSLSLKVEQDQAFYLQDFYRHMQTLAWILILLLPISLWLLRRFSAHLVKPINQVRELGKRISAGDYGASDYQSGYQELDELVATMNHLAHTLQVKIQGLNDARDVAEASEKMKSQFLANMSHEIRTPMNGILGFLQLLERQALTDQQRDWTAKAVASAKSLLNILNDILDLSKVEAGAILLESIPFNLPEMLHLIISNQGLAAAKKGVALELKIPDAMPSTWLGDPTRIGQIVRNLVSNAVKFTERGLVLIDADCRQDQKGQWLIIRVIDTGIGMDDEQLSSLFKPFIQADASTTRKYGGTGLGLTISQSLAQLMGGHIEVTSEPGEGSCFTLEILSQSLSEPAVAMENQGGSDHIPDLGTYRILIAEDNLINMEILIHTLKETGATLHLAKNGAEALELALRLQPDVVLMDAQMPQMDGIEATRRLREEGFLNPIVMQTANVSSEDRVLYQEAGANELVGKPIDRAQLFKVLTKAMTPPAHARPAPATQPGL